MKKSLLLDVLRCHTFTARTAEGDPVRSHAVGDDD